MTAEQTVHAVWLDNTRIGTLTQRRDNTWFTFTDEYLEDPDRSVLGLAFEEDLRARRSSNMRVPPWFSNLLPEGRLRQWISDELHVSSEREMELLARVGFDLPGAVRVLADGISPAEAPAHALAEDEALERESDPGWRFSLAGVALKFSMVEQGERLTLPAFGEGGDWIVKLPDPNHPDVPVNEFAMMTLAERAGIGVPEFRLVERKLLEPLPDTAWQSAEKHAYAVRRFDRSPGRGLVHIEDLAQVRSFYPLRKYDGSFETVASLIYRGFDLGSLIEFARRLAFNVLIANGDAHLKNWSLIYSDPRRPTLSPAYDLVATEHYVQAHKDEDLGLTFCGTRRLDSINPECFHALEMKLGIASRVLQDAALETVEKAVDAWPAVSEILSANEPLMATIDRSIKHRSKSLGLRIP